MIYRVHLHVGNTSELNSIIRNGSIPGGKASKQTVFFTTVNPMDDGNGMGETPRDLTKPRIAPYKNTWKRLEDTVFSCAVLKLAQERGLVKTKHGHMQPFSTTLCCSLH